MPARPPAPETPPQMAKPASVDEITRHLADAIAGKRLPPGTWLREEALGRTYGVSRTKIRGALLALSKEKLVEMVPDKGAFVSRPSVQEAREVFAMRRLLEAEVVRLLVDQASATTWRKLEQHVKAERAGLSRPHTHGSVSERLLGDLHVLMADLAGNQTLAGMVSELVSRSSLIAMLYFSRNDPNCSTDEHAHLLAACRAGDSDGAVRLMVEHLDRIEASLDLSDKRPPETPDLLQTLLLS